MKNLPWPVVRKAISRSGIKKELVGVKMTLIQNKAKFLLHHHHGTFSY